MRHRDFVLVLLCSLAGCAGGEAIDAPAGGVSDTGTEPLDERDAQTDSLATDSTADSATTADTSVTDASVDTNLADSGVVDTRVVDTSVADTSAVDAAPADTGFKATDHVHIYIDNFCKVSTSPTSFTVPAGETLQLSYHNHSVDYRADVWMMYGGGYLALEKGATWNETYKHCFGPSPSVGYADISIEGGGGSACPEVRLMITCK